MVQALEAFQALRIEQYTSVAGLAALFYNHLLTLEWEVQYYLRGRWGFARVVFLIARYLPYVGAAFATQEAVLSFVSSDPRTHVSCYDVLFAVSSRGNYVRIASVLSAELLLNIRIWALWEKNRWILGIQLLTAAIALPVALYFNLVAVAMPSRYRYDFCADQVSAGAFFVSSVIIAYELVLFFLVLLRRKQLKTVFGVLKRPNNTSSFFELIIKDGIVYFLAIVAVSATIVITGFVLGGRYSAMLETFQLAIHSSASCGAILHIVENDTKGRELPSTISQTISLQIPPTPSSKPRPDDSMV